MPTKRKTLEDDPERLAERIYSFSRRKIKDKATFDLWWREYMGDGLSSRQDGTLKKKTFNAMQRRIPEIDRRDLFKKAGGKNLRRDRRTRARVVVRTPQEYIRRGAQNVDLQGLDTPPRKHRAGLYNRVGRVKNKVVYVKKTSVVVKGVKRTRYRAKNGRFASVR